MWVSYVPYLVILSLVGMVMFIAHRSDKHDFTLFDLISDVHTGRAGMEKILMLLAGLSVTWWFIDAAAHARATAMDVITYAATMGLARYANKLTDAHLQRKETETL